MIYCYLTLTEAHSKCTVHTKKNWGAEQLRTDEQWQDVWDGLIFNSGGEERPANDGCRAFVMNATKKANRGKALPEVVITDTYNYNISVVLWYV